MGQVWSKADFDGNRELGHEGGCGSCLAVTAQNPGQDGIWETDDDLLTPLNQAKADISIDGSSGGPTNLDRVRGFYSFHSGGGNFAMGDGSVHFIPDDIATTTYVWLSTIDQGEITSFK